MQSEGEGGEGRTTSHKMPRNRVQGRADQAPLPKQGQHGEGDSRRGYTAPHRRQTHSAPQHSLEGPEREGQDVQTGRQSSERHPSPQRSPGGGTSTVHGSHESRRPPGRGERVAQARRTVQLQLGRGVTTQARAPQTGGRRAGGEAGEREAPTRRKHSSTSQRAQGVEEREENALDETELERGEGSS